MVRRKRRAQTCCSLYCWCVLQMYRLWLFAVFDQRTQLYPKRKIFVLQTIWLERIPRSLDFKFAPVLWGAKRSKHTVETFKAYVEYFAMFDHPRTKNTRVSWLRQWNDWGGCDVIKLVVNTGFESFSSKNKFLFRINLNWKCSIGRTENIRLLRLWKGTSDRNVTEWLELKLN